MLEIIRPGASAARARVALFDFDGTLSLIRSGWVDVMVPMMVEILAGLKTGETEAELRAIVEDFVWRLTGKDTINQMMEFAGHVQKRGGTPLDPLQYKKMYLDLLWVRIRDRVEALRSGKADPEQYLVPGARALLEQLKARGLRLYLAIGFGDGYVEIEEVKNVGGVAVGVATTEPECVVIDDWKRLRLIGVGADFIVPNFLCQDELMAALFPHGRPVEV
jgi:phosphoglycolate phosphatase